MIFLLRHGRIADRLPGEPRRFLGSADIPLSPQGREEVRVWAGAMAGFDWGAVLTSPLRRARETARLVAPEGPEPEVLEGLAEIGLGEWDGLTKAEIRERFPGQWEARGEDLAGFRPPGGESFGDLWLRVRSAWETLAARGEKQDILVTAHAGVNRAILAHVLGLPLDICIFRLGQDSAALNILAFSRLGWRVRALNLTPGEPAGELAQVLAGLAIQPRIY